MNKTVSNLRKRYFCFFLVGALGFSCGPLNATERPSFRCLGGVADWRSSTADQIRREILNGRFPGITSQVPSRISIPRRGQWNSSRLEGLVGLYEVSLARISSLHPIPNPLREDSNEQLENLKSLISSHGYHLSKAIQVAILRNGQILNLGGHHRVAAMLALGESTIPASVYVWDSMDPHIRGLYREQFIVPLQHRFPELFGTIQYDSTLLD
ncbi:MAG: ParB-like nuclease domain-containing protein [Bdellovibrionales bacterium]|nr:ParB-like nuclease domain-containing protein [Bdellovibrionales bacterium]